jgi:hypothetical protein
MNRLSVLFFGLIILGWLAGAARAADPAAEPMAQPIPHAEQPAIQVGPEIGGACCQPDNRCRRGLIGGAGIYWMQPYFIDNPAFTVSTTTLTGPGGTLRTTTERINISQHMEVAPQLWLGYLSDAGLGARVRWWYFRQGTGQSISVPAATPGTLTFLSSAAPLGFSAFVDNDGSAATLATTSKLQFQVWDAEAINSVQTGRWDLLFAGGLRFVHINHQYNAFVGGDSGGDAGGDAGAPIRASVLSGHSFHGIGPVLALEARRALGDSGLSLYSSARGAVLFGSAKQNATDIFISEDGTFADSSTDTRNSVLSVVDLELGLEFGRNVGSSHVFGQVALVGQEWWGAGSASRAVNVNSFGVPSQGGAIVDTNLGFVGVVFRVGVNY